MSTYQGNSHIVWLGHLADYPSAPTINEAFYHVIDKRSYIYMGELQGWSQMTEDGRAGDYATTIYKNSDTTPATPIGGSYDGYTEVAPSGWTKHPEPTVGPERTWISKSVYWFDGNSWQGRSWSIPSWITGLDGEKGEAAQPIHGQFRSIVFLNGVDRPEAPVGGSFDGQVEVYPIGGWSGEPINPDIGQYVWESVTTYTYYPELLSWKNGGWSVPAKHSGDKGDKPLKGIDYQDGVGNYHSYIYQVLGISHNPNTPIGGSYDGVNEVIPDGWSDDPPPVGKGQYLWLSTMMYQQIDEDTWLQHRAWSVPTRVSGTDGYTPQYGVDYRDGKSGKFISYVYKNAESRPTYPIGGSFDGVHEVVPTGWTDDPFAPRQNEFTWVSRATYYQEDSNSTWERQDQGGDNETGWTNPVQFSGTVGAAGKVLTLSSDHQVFQFDSDNDLIEPSVINFTAFKTNLQDDPTVWSSEPVGLLTDITDTTAKLTIENFGTNQSVQVTAKAGIGADEVGDTITVIRVTGGSDSVAGYLTNESHTVSTDYLGNGANLIDAGGEFIVYFGSNEVTDSCNFSVLGNSAGLSISIGSDGVYSISGLTVDDATATLRAEYQGINLYKVYSIAKSRAGLDANILTLSTDSQTFAYDGDNNLIAPSQINFSVYKVNLDSDATVWTSIPAGLLTSTHDTGAVLTAGNFGSNTNVVVEAEAGGIKDTITIVKIKDGVDGVIGPAGPQGPAGDDGNDGSTIYTEFWFSENGLGNPDTQPSEWGTTQRASDEYTINKVVTNGVSGAWSEVTKFVGSDGVQGEGGKYTETIYRANETQPNTPSAVNNPADWSTEIPDVIYPVLVWASTATKHADGNLDTLWSEPRQWNGTRGDDSVVGYLTNESHNVATDNSGNGGDYSTAGGEFVVYDGLDKVNSSTSFSVLNVSAGLNISIDTNGIYTVTGANLNSSTATLRAIYSGVTIDKVYTISKSREGSKGDTGDTGERGSRRFFGTASTWSDSVALTVITDAGYTPIELDTVTLSDDSVGFAETQYISDISGTEPVLVYTWELVEQVINGNLIVHGTVGADQIAARSIAAGKIVTGTLTANEIKANTITGNEISSATKIEAGTSGTNYAAMSGVSGDHGFWAGNTNDDIAPFRVTRAGALTATSANITGNITGSTISGGIINGSQINVPQSNPKFTVNSSGEMSCIDADIRGTLYAEDIEGDISSGIKLSIAKPNPIGIFTLKGFTKQRLIQVNQLSGSFTVSVPMGSGTGTGTLYFYLKKNDVTLDTQSLSLKVSKNPTGPSSENIRFNLTLFSSGIDTQDTQYEVTYSTSSPSGGSTTVGLDPDCIATAMMDSGFIIN